MHVEKKKTTPSLPGTSSLKNFSGIRLHDQVALEAEKWAAPSPVDQRRRQPGRDR